MMAPWLIRHLEQTGAWSRDGIGRVAKLRRCQACPAWTITGLDADRCAFAVTTDTQPLSPLGEALAVVTGRVTFALRRTAGSRITLDHRHPIAIAATPAGAGDYDVVAAHVCGADVLPTIPSKYQPSTRRQELPDAAPF